MKNYHTLGALLLTLPLLAVTGCDNMSEPSDQSSQQPNQTSQQPNQSSQRQDSGLNVAITEALQRDAVFAQSDITVVVSPQGQVTLNGTVASMQDKNRAGEIAKQVAGTRTVNNNLEIVTPGNRD